MDDIAGFYHPPPPGLHSYHHHHPPPVVVAAAPPPSHIALVPHEPYHQFHHHHQPHSSLAPYALPLASPPPPSHDELRTLFVAGLPEDVKPREIYNLFREFPGYESSNLRIGGKRDSQPFAFAVFSDQHSAVAAMHAISGMVFDLEKGSTLHIDLAKSNSKSKRSRIDDGLDSHKKFKGPAFARPSYDSGVGSFHTPGMSISAHNTIGYSTALRGYSETGTAKPKNNSDSATRSNPPCPTLFVANIGTHCDELELTQAFSRYPGFIKLKIQGTYGTPIAFVDYQDTAGSTEALNQLQGAILYSSSGEGLRIEYAKSRMGRRKKSK